MTGTARDTALLLIGSNGRVGRLVTKAWSLNPPEARFLTQARQPAEDKTVNRLVWNPADGARALKAHVDAHGPVSTMVVMAGVVPASGRNLDDNAAIVRACLLGARDAGIGRVLVASSSAVYGAWKQTPYAEGDATRPVNHYGQSKLDMEDEARRSAGDTTELTFLRIGNIAGADALLINRARATTAMPLRIHRFGDGKGPLRSYIGPVSLARLLARLATSHNALPDVINVAAPTPVQMEDLATRSGMPWTYVPAPQTAHQRITLDTSLLGCLCPLPVLGSGADAIIGEWAGLDTLDAAQ